MYGHPQNLVSACLGLGVFCRVSVPEDKGESSSSLSSFPRLIFAFLGTSATIQSPLKAFLSKPWN